MSKVSSSKVEKIESKVKKSKISKNDSYYIASGFFNKDQVATVDAVENSLIGLNLNYFSPRSESIPFFSEKNSEFKSMMTKLIFNNNLDRIDACNKFIINLENNDQGTLFEYGYIAGKFLGKNMFTYEFSRSVKIMNDAINLESKVLKSGSKMLTELLPQGKDYDFISDLLTNYPLLKLYREKSQVAILCIDDRDPINLFLIGLCYSSKIPVITYSHEGHGSNVMLVHSSTHAETVKDLNILLDSLESDLLSSLNNYKGSVSDDEEVLSDYYLTQAALVGLSSIYLNKQEWNKTID